jgi:hypothetical protein
MNKKLLLAIYLLSLIAYINCGCNCCDQCNDDEEEEQPQGTCPALKKISSSFRGTGWASRYWDCCKPSCSWSNNAGWGNEARECDVNQNVLSDKNSKSLCDWGVSTTCLSQAPFTLSGCDNLGFAFASVPGGSGAICGRCFALEFTGEGKYETRKNHKALAGKKLIVMASNIGYDVTGGQFDILIPGGGEGYYTGKCTKVLGNFQTTQYGGLLSDCENSVGWSLSDDDMYTQRKQCLVNKCNSLFANKSKAKQGCLFLANFLEAAGNPVHKYYEVECPQVLKDRY